MSSTLSRSPSSLLALLAALLLALAAATSARADVVPVADCLTPTGTAGSSWVYYGYVNTGTSTSIPFGDDNQVVPGIGFQGQPTVFNTGSYPRVFRAVFNTNAFTEIAWLLDGHEASANLAHTPQCLAGATDAASDLAPDAATLHGVVTPEGSDTAYEFSYGRTIAYGSTTPERHSSSTAAVPVEETLTGLAPATTYHYRLIASGTITTAGEDRTFTTAAAANPPADQVTTVATVVAPPAPPSATPSPTVVTTALANLRLAHRASGRALRAGATATLRLVATNAGPAPATGVVLAERLPAGLRLVAAQVGRRRCTGTTTIRCRIGTMASGATATATLRVTARRAGRYTDVASVAGAQPDPAAGDNVASGTLRFRAAPAKSTTRTA